MCKLCSKSTKNTPEWRQWRPAEDGIRDIVNFNRQKFDPYADLVDEAYVNFNGNAMPMKQLKDDIRYIFSEEQDEKDCENCDAGLKSWICMPEIPSDSIAENIQILNDQQRL